MENYAVLSLETHLFFARIMKEHALFLRAGFPCGEGEWIRRAENYRQQFENLLRDAVQISDGRLNEPILCSQELVTEFTMPAEHQTNALSGIPIDSRITRQELELSPYTPVRRGQKAASCKPMRYEQESGACAAVHSRQETASRACPFEDLERSGVIDRLNRRALRLLDGFIRFKEAILREVREGNLFTSNYPLLVDHILREAKLYRATVAELQNGECLSYRDVRKTEDFWNRIMMEHALFIRGLLDPSETELIAAADEFAGEFRELLGRAKEQNTRVCLEQAQRQDACEGPTGTGQQNACGGPTGTGQRNTCGGPTGTGQQNACGDPTGTGQRNAMQRPAQAAARSFRQYPNRVSQQPVRQLPVREIRQSCPLVRNLTESSLAETMRLRDFKAAGAEGILNGKIASIILPLLADHVLREANHYIRLLKCAEEV